MELPLVVGVDGSYSSLTAVDWATDEAARHGLPLRLVYASLWERYEGVRPTSSMELPSEQVMAENVIATATERAQRRNPRLKVSGDVLPEDAVSALLREGSSAVALVTGCRGRSELKGLLLGSVSLAVAARASGPVIVIRGDEAGLIGAHGRILLGAGEPGATDEAVRFAFREAEVRECVLDVVRAWRHPARETIGHPGSAGETAREDERRASDLLDVLLLDAMTDHPDVRVRRSTVEGPAHSVLLRRSAAADLTVIGARRRQGHLRHLGRVSHRLLNHADCPVAIVPQRV
ncbi:universal stress protein [Streptomyces chiangmaiensis]|uniref:Universal stress protein n=1 Tax=Streptomyces chiangmaiensis TaxID=766497 RepID=A0ABU7FVG1_9ACTN|nr:universal stress protein [Streptomyces chiangmaiensis]MED7827783.1 universal stress protein [Streptomyces chiangmaiensis]